LNNVDAMIFAAANLPKKGNKIQYSFHLDKKRAYEIVTRGVSRKEDGQSFPDIEHYRG
jgi:hypothetical protein